MHRRFIRRQARRFPYRACGAIAAAVCLLAATFLFPGRDSGTVGALSERNDDRQAVPVELREEVLVALVSCGGKMAKDLQMVTKSILYNFDPTRYNIHIYTFTDDEARLSKKDPRLLTEIEQIPYARLTELDVHKVGISETHLNLFRTCAGARLAFPVIDALKNVEKIMYLDTDTLVLHDLSELWDYFAEFNASQHSAMTQQATRIHKYGWYMSPAGAQSVCKEDDPPVCVPFYGLTGLNSGVYLMHLDRMRRRAPLTVHAELMDIVNGPAKENHHKFQLGDQDVLNYYFHDHPDELFELPCHWNYRTDSYCYNRPAILHGNRQAFHWNEQHPNVWTVTWRAYEYVEYHSLMDPRWKVESPHGDR